MQADIWQHYQSTHPGEVQVLGADIWNGSAAQLRNFKNSTGATFPLLLNGGSATGGNLNTLYGPFDNYVVINKTGVVRYNSVIHPHGSRYQLDELLACIDSLVSPPLDVGDGPGRGLALSSQPNPFRGSTTIEFTNPASATLPARVTVHDLQGRRVATLWEGHAPQGVTRVTWDGRDASGIAAAPGVYVLRGEIGGVALSRRITRLR